MLGAFPSALERPLALTGRVLLGLYFIVPGLSKVTGFGATSEYMALHGVPLVPVLLVLTIAIQVGGGLCLLIGWRQQMMALVLAALTLVINVFMHDFWNEYESTTSAHEMQNFIKNLAIMAGLLFVAGTRSEVRPDP